MARPLQYKTPALMQEVIDEYFEMCKEETRPYTVTGLAIALDLTMKGLTDYGERDAFSATVKKAKLKVENYAAEKLYGGQVAGIIFNLKNNFGWVDKHEHGIDGQISLKDEHTKVLALLNADTSVT